MPRSGAADRAGRTSRGRAGRQQAAQVGKLRTQGGRCQPHARIRHLFQGLDQPPGRDCPVAKACQFHRPILLAVSWHEPMLKLTDTNLLRTRAYVAGQWIDASGGGTVAGHESGHRRAPRHRPGLRRGRNARRHRGRRRGAAGLARAHGEGARGAAAQAPRPAARQPGRPRADHDRRAGQAAGGVPRRDRLLAPASSSGSARRRSASTAT